MKIYFAFQCHNFQHRACWLLSSIMQQNCWPFDFVADIACMKDNGTPTTEYMAEYFISMGMNIRLSIFDNKDIFARRGHVRNYQTNNAIKNNADYIYFADACHVYHEDFFNSLLKWLNISDKNNHGIIYSPIKKHTVIKDTDRLICNAKNEIPYIKNAFKRADNLPVVIIPKDQQKNGAAPGCMQVVAVKYMIEKCNGIYCPENELKDRHLFNEGQRAWSDMYFRGLIGKSIKIKLPMQIHMGHLRDKDFGYHIEEQR